MVASTRFRRLFASGGAFSLFMPVLVKTYAESQNHSGIRQAIVYAVHRFFAQHGGNFVFQSIDIVAHITMVPDSDGDWIAKNFYSLFSTLQSAVPSSVPDAAGIRHSNKDQEREALMVSTAEEKPQTFLASLRQRRNNGKNLVSTSLPEEYEAKRLRLDDFVKLFLTIIAHDCSTSRAEEFLRLFRFLTPYFYHASGTARSVLRDGIDALGLVLLKAAGKAKTPEPPLVRGGDTNITSQSSEGAFLDTRFLEGSKTPSDLMSMRLDYLSLVVSFTRSGGQLQITSSRRIIELVKAMLKDSSDDKNERIASSFAEYFRLSMLRSDHPNLKDVIIFLGDLVPLITLHGIDVDFSGLFDTISNIQYFVNEPALSQLIVTQLCAAALRVCELAASEGLLSTLSMRHSLVFLMAKAIFIRGADMMAEVEKCTPSCDFLAGIILPLVMALKSSMDSTSEDVQMQSRLHSVLARTWIRLLSYTMSAYHNAIKIRDNSQPSARTKSPRSSSFTSTRAQNNFQIMVLQIIKVIVIRAETDLSSRLPGIWSQVASFFRPLLEDGNANFALRSQERSTAVSPAQSPKTNAAQYDATFASFQSVGFDYQSPVFAAQTPRGPRFVDFSMWSLFELLCQCRHPLLLQMRLFMRIKVAELDQLLRSQQNNLPLSNGRSPRASSIFSKPRRMSGLPSPDGSLGLSPSQSIPILKSPDSLGQPGYRQFPSSPVSVHETHGQRIMHLGLVDSRENGGRVLAKSPVVKSPSLVRATYRRIRLVQSCMGFDTLLLPLPDDEREEEDEGWAAAWTGKQALDAIVKETRELMEEFEEFARIEDDDGILVDPNQSLAI
jgi:hypothetical protein